MGKKFKFRYVNEIVGGFVLVVCLLLVAGIIVAGNAQNWFEKMIRIELDFPPQGSMELQKGAEVLLLGARIGSVHEISVDDDGEITGSIRVRGSFMRFIREDSVARVKRKLVVTGDAYIELSRGTGKEVPRSGGVIDCEPDTDLMVVVEEMIQDFRAELTQTLGLVNEAISEYTALARILNDPEGDVSLLLANMNTLIDEYSKLAVSLNDPDGEVFTLLGNVNGLVEEIKSGGVLQTAEELMISFDSLAKELEVVVVKLPEMADTLSGEVDNLPALIGEARTLMRESTALLEGLQRHWFLRKYMEAGKAGLSEEVLLP
jgi:phospholipid/cholesterol/gamma-HCH transport system substrate-binding protein